MRDKIIYHIIRILKSDRDALDYAIKMQIKEMKNKNENAWWYWHNKIAKDDTK